MCSGETVARFSGSEVSDWWACGSAHRSWVILAVLFGAGSLASKQERRLPGIAFPSAFLHFHALTMAGEWSSSYMVTSVSGSGKCWATMIHHVF